MTYRSEVYVSLCPRKGTIEARRVRGLLCGPGRSSSEPGVGWGGGSALAGTSRLPARGGVSRPVELVAAFLL